MFIASHFGFYFALAYFAGIWGHNLVVALSGVLMLLLIWMSISDIESFIIPDTASLLLIILGLLATWVLKSESVLNHIVAMYRLPL